MWWDVEKIVLCFSTVWAFWMNFSEHLGSWGNMLREFQRDLPNSRGMCLHFKRKWGPGPWRHLEVVKSQRATGGPYGSWRLGCIFQKARMRTQDPSHPIATEQRFFFFHLWEERGESCPVYKETTHFPLSLTRAMSTTYAGVFPTWLSSHHLRGKNSGKGESHAY